MNEIIQRLIAKTGLPEQQAAVAVETVIGFLKEKLPPSMGAQLDSLVSGQPGAMDKMGGLGASLGGMFGKNE